VDGWGVWCVFVWCSVLFWGWAGGCYLAFERLKVDIRCYIVYYYYIIILYTIIYYILYSYLIFSSYSSPILPIFSSPFYSSLLFLSQYSFPIFILYLSVLTYTYLYSIFLILSQTSYLSILKGIHLLSNV
jgi:hypothetical protein